MLGTAVWNGGKQTVRLNDLGSPRAGVSKLFGEMICTIGTTKEKGAVNADGNAQD